MKASDKITQKMTRDGLVEENLATGEVSNISNREAETDYSAHADAPQPHAAKRVVIERRRVRSKQVAKQTVMTDSKESGTQPRLFFESGPKRTGGRLRHELLTRPGTEIRAAAYRKVNDTERDNVGVDRKSVV